MRTTCRSRRALSTGCLRATSRRSRRRSRQLSVSTPGMVRRVRGRWSLRLHSHRTHAHRGRAVSRARHHRRVVRVRSTARLADSRRGSWLQAFGPDRSAWYSGALQITIAFGQGGMSIGFTGDSVEYTIVRYVAFWALLGECWPLAVQLSRPANGVWNLIIGATAKWVRDGAAHAMLRECRRSDGCAGRCAC